MPKNDESRPFAHIVTDPNEVAKQGINPDLSQNRTLMAVQLTEHEPVRPQLFKGEIIDGEYIPGPRNMDDVFKHYKPECDVTMESEDGTPVVETLTFNNMGDFLKKGIVKQSPFLKDLAFQQEEFMQFSRQLKSNKILRSMLANPESKAAYLAILQELIEQLEEAE